MSLFRNAVFHTTVANLNNLPVDSVREIAFAGRSNAGKSSAIILLGALRPGRYAFVEEYHENEPGAQGTIIAE